MERKRAGQPQRDRETGRQTARQSKEREKDREGEAKRRSWGTKWLSHTTRVSVRLHDISYMIYVMECGSLSEFFFCLFLSWQLEPDVQGIEATPSDGQQLIAASIPRCGYGLWKEFNVCSFNVLWVFSLSSLRFFLFFSFFGLLCVISGHYQVFCLSDNAFMKRPCLPLKYLSSLH